MKELEAALYDLRRAEVEVSNCQLDEDDALVALKAAERAYDVAYRRVSELKREPVEHTGAEQQ